VKTLTLVAYKRPAYTAQVLTALTRCRRLAEFDRMAIFIDPGVAEVANVCRAFTYQLPLPVKVTVNETRLGVADNPIGAYRYVFDELGTDFNVAIEDDAVLSSDALELALWFYARHCCADSRYAFMNLCDHDQYRGTGLNAHGVPEDPSLLAESVRLSSPFAWCYSKSVWPFVKKNWNKNVRSIWGWDWSLRLAMRMEGMISLTPVVSRCQNIGRLDGTWENEETFRVQLGLRYSDGSYRGDYALVNPVSDREARVLEKWMLPEVPRYLSEKLAHGGRTRFTA